MMKRPFGNLIFIPALLTFFSFEKRPVFDYGVVEINIHHTVADKPLILNEVFSNSQNEKFTVTKFKYYLSNIRLNGAKEINPADKTYFLVDESEPETKKISVRIKAGTYQSISFLIGVDSLRNISGAQSGALDPINGMFWTWNSGYIMAKLEGVSPVSSLPGNKFEYHIGGFKGPHNVLKYITLRFPEDAVKEIVKKKSLTINMSADISEWFQHPAAISIASTPSCSATGSLAKKFADNYADMFHIISVSGK